MAASVTITIARRNDGMIVITTYDQQNQPLVTTTLNNDAAVYVRDRLDAVLREKAIT